jgi:hypothetical protein
MAEGKQKEAWNHTASLLAMLVNTAFGKKGRPVEAGKFHPFEKQQPRARLSREETASRLNEFVGLKRHGRNPTPPGKRPQSLEPDRAGGHDDGG